jgi:hypothetical protein
VLCRIVPAPPLRYEALTDFLEDYMDRQEQRVARGLGRDFVLAQRDNNRVLTVFTSSSRLSSRSRTRVVRLESLKRLEHVRLQFTDTV